MFVSSLEYNRHLQELDGERCEREDLAEWHRVVIHSANTMATVVVATVYGVEVLAVVLGQPDRHYGNGETRQRYNGKDEQ